jgi:hypothetical protein
MYKNYLNRNGEIVTKTFKELKTTWTKMNEYKCNYGGMLDEIAFLKKYGLQPTIFNIANLRKLDHVYLTEHYVKVCLEHSAKDLREVKTHG